MTIKAIRILEAYADEIEAKLGGVVDFDEDSFVWDTSGTPFNLRDDVFSLTFTVNTGGDPTLEAVEKDLIGALNTLVDGTDDSIDTDDPLNAYVLSYSRGDGLDLINSTAGLDLI